jgi:hypothetical protein
MFLMLKILGEEKKQGEDHIRQVLKMLTTYFLGDRVEKRY